MEFIWKKGNFSRRNFSFITPKKNKKQKTEKQNKTKKQKQNKNKNKKTKKTNKQTNKHFFFEE